MPIAQTGYGSGFQFKSYLINRFDLQMINPSKEGLVPANMELNIEIAIVPPIYFSKKKIYQCGVGCVVKMTPIIDGQKTDIFCVLNSGILGHFESDGRFEPGIEERIAKVQAPALLFPYLRGALTTFFAIAALGSVIFPLININQIAEDSLKDIPIKVIDE